MVSVIKIPKNTTRTKRNTDVWFKLVDAQLEKMFINRSERKREVL